MNTRKELILHIGQYKTGSSSIQNFLIGYTDFLASKSAHYCRTGLLFNEPEIGIRHYKLTENTETGDCLWDKLVDEINSSHSSKFIVSHENMLFRLSEDNLTYIKQKLVNFDLKIVCYLRRQDKFMSSWYGEQVQNHHCCSNVSDFIRTYKLSCFYGSALKKGLSKPNKSQSSSFSAENSFMKFSASMLEKTDNFSSLIISHHLI